LLFGESIMTGTSIVLHPPAGTLRAGAAPAWEFVSAG
jgi:hypothetical protein